MNTSLALYKTFVEGLVRIRPSILARWIKGQGWPQTPENEKFNQLLSQLTAEQREILAQIAQSARSGGIHDRLAYINDEISRGGLRLVRQEVELAVEPYGTELC